MSLACIRLRHSKLRFTGQRRIEPVDKVGEQHLAADLQKNVQVRYAVKNVDDFYFKKCAMLR
jgi:hypothetical protein